MHNHRFLQSEIKVVIKRGRPAHARYSLLKWRPNDIGQNRLAFAVSRRHVRTSVKRNLIKRHHRETARTLALSSPGRDIVVFSKSGIDGLDSAKVRHDAHTLWNRLNTSPVKS